MATCPLTRAVAPGDRLGDRPSLVFGRDGEGAVPSGLRRLGGLRRHIEELCNLLPPLSTFGHSDPSIQRPISLSVRLPVRRKATRSLRANLRETQEPIAG